ncbi:MAG: hypothetical protein WCO04_18905 [Pseudomonadota bacterium]
MDTVAEVPSSTVAGSAGNDPVELGLYQTYITSILMLEDRRSHASGIYASVIAACIAAGGLADLNLLYLAAASFFTAAIWLLSLNYFAALARVKWRTAEELEKRFALRPFTIEYEKMKAQRRDPKKRNFGMISRERMMPVTILVLSGGYLCLTAAQFICDLI